MCDLIYDAINTLYLKLRYLKDIYNINFHLKVGIGVEFIELI